MHVPSFDTFSDSAQARVACEELFTGRFIHVHGVGWLEWTGKLWQGVPDKVPLDALRAWTEGKLAAVVDAAAAEGPPQSEAAARARRKRLEAWRKRLGTGPLSNALTLLRGFPGVSVRPEELDAHPDLLNCRNGIVHLRWGDLTPHSPAMYLTKITDTDYRPTALHQDWTTALTAIPTHVHACSTCEDPAVCPHVCRHDADPPRCMDVQAWLQVRFGQAITGHLCPDDVVIVQLGTGRNGKSTVLEGIAAAAGDYYFLGSDKILIGNHTGAHTTDLADLQGKRLVALEETPETGRLDTQLLKKIAGTERITARKMRQDNVSFPATHTLFVNTNHLPAIMENDVATWERLLLVVYPYTFAADPAGDNQRPKDTRLRARMRNAPVREAVLAWLVEGAVASYADGELPAPPPPVVADTERWRDSSDLVTTFWGDYLDPDPRSYIYAGDLIWMFNEFLDQRGQKGVAESTFKRRFEHHPITTGSLVVHKRIRQDTAGLRQSRPYGALDPFARLPGCPQGRVCAWVGVGFRARGDVGDSERADQGFSAGQP